MIEEILYVILTALVAFLILFYRNKIKGLLWTLIYFKDSEEFEEVVAQLDTPFKVQAYMDTKFKYRKNTKPEHHWQSAIETWKLKEGDCEDWAIFAIECLKKHFATEVFCCYGETTGHATCLIILVYRFVTVGTFGLIEHGEIDYPELAEHWYPDWESYSIYDEDIRFVESVSR